MGSTLQPSDSLALCLLSRLSRITRRSGNAQKGRKKKKEKQTRKIFQRTFGAVLAYTTLVNWFFSPNLCAFMVVVRKKKKSGTGREGSWTALEATVIKVDKNIDTARTHKSWPPRQWNVACADKPATRLWNELRAGVIGYAANNQLQQMVQNRGERETLLTLGRFIVFRLK